MKARRLRWLAAGLVAAAVAVAGPLAFIHGGFYDVAATAPHSTLVQWLVETVMRRSVEKRALDVKVPPLDDPRLIARGRALHDAHCVACHGAPGVAPGSEGLGLMPPPANLAYTAREWKAAEVYWVVKNGIRMTGMPAWGYRLDEPDLWAIVAFLRVLPTLSPAAYRETAQAPLRAGPVVSTHSVPDAERGARALHQYACATCHVIPGIVGANVTVGPPLGGIARRGILGGLVPNTPENMVRWLQRPQDIYPEGAMPNLGVTEGDARDIAAYLATLK